MIENINLVSTNDLITELSSRYDAFVMVGMKLRDNIRYDVRKTSTGPRYLCIGMMENFKCELLEKVRKEEIVNDGLGT